MLNVRAHYIARRRLMWLPRLLPGTNARLLYCLLMLLQPKRISSSYQVLIAHGWNVLYVVDDHEMLPDFYRLDGNSYYIGGVAWHYVSVLVHEIEHLRCECDLRN
jgi:hypothetical protein